MKSRRLRSVGLGKSWKKKLDALCKQAVFARDRVCMWCGDKGEHHHWAHIRSRRYLSTRWNMDNSIRLCAGCHLKWHHQPLAATSWFKECFPLRAQTLEFIDRVGEMGKKIDKEAIRIELEQEIARYGA